MEPMVPPIIGAPPHIAYGIRKLMCIAENVVRKDAALQRAIHPLTAKALAKLVDSMNCYYSNLIEGHGTSPADIERALSNVFSEDKKQRNLQDLSVAHIRIDRMMKQRLMDSTVDICAADFLSWLHKEFYSGMTKNAWGTEKIPDFMPGRIRCPDDINNGLVTLGDYIDAHVPPDSTSLQQFLDRFHFAYTPADRNTRVQV
jgi:Fic family protein